MNRFFNRSNFEQKQVENHCLFEEFWNCRFRLLIDDLFFALLPVAEIGFKPYRKSK